MPGVVVHQADKGGAVVVLDKELYLKENKKMLSDKKNYTCLGSDPTSIFKEKLEKLINEGLHLGVPTQKQTNVLNKEHACIPVFHSLPKMHKPGFPPAFCPIVTGINSLNENLCAWVDSLIQPLIKIKSQDI